MGKHDQESAAVGVGFSAFVPLPAPNFWKPDVRIHRRQPVALSDTEAVDRAHRGE